MTESFASLAAKKRRWNTRAMMNAHHLPAAFRIWLVLSVACFMCQAPCNFATPRQLPSRQVREKEGIAKSVKAERLNALTDLSEDGKKLLNRISDAGRNGDWLEVRRLFGGYAGAEVQIFNAVMHIALKCGQVQQGEHVYQKLCGLNIPKTSPTITAALKIYSRLGQDQAVRQIWAEAKQSMNIDEVMACARIEAAADQGDIETAARVLDELRSYAVEMDTLHVTSAIRACRNAEGCNHNAATFLYRLLLDSGLEPDIVTFTCVVGAYANAPLRSLLEARDDMVLRGIQPNKLFAETYLTSVLAIMKDEVTLAGTRTARQFAEYLISRPPARLKEARAALAGFKSAGVKLSQLSLCIDEALQILAVEQT
ncbi:unnamed protein product [Symbiodinium sp. CCMP2456]|nr:unnamed protein product [Symbiodinium sp. CCMP2456]